MLNIYDFVKFKYFKYAVITLVLAFLCYQINEIFPPFILAFILAYLLNPLINYMESKKISRLTAIILMISVIILFITMIAIFIVPIISREFEHLYSKLPKYFYDIKMHIMSLNNDAKVQYAKKILPQYSDDISEIILRNISTVSERLLASSNSLITNLSFLFITPVISFYLIRDWKMIIENAKNLLPIEFRDKLVDTCKKCDYVLSSYLRGQLYVVAILMIYYSVVLEIMNVNYSVLIGTTTGILSFMPYVGALTGGVITCVVSFFQFGFGMKFMIVIALFLFGQFLEGNVLFPKFVGDKVGIHPIVIIFSLMAGGVLFGFMGLLCAVPVCACAKILLQEKNS